MKTRAIDIRRGAHNATATFRKLLPDAYRFDFVDGPYPDGPAAGIDLFYTPPYYKLYERFTLESLNEGHKWLLSYIKGMQTYLHCQSSIPASN